MRFIIFLGVIVVFISCFFIFFTFDSMIKTKFVCDLSEKIVCNVREFNMSIVVGILIVGMLLFVDTLVVYLMVKTWIPDTLLFR